MSEVTLPNSARLSKKTVVLMCILVMALGLVVWWNYYIKLRSDALKGRLPFKGQVKDFDAWVDQNGTPRTLKEAKGKILVLSCVYTTCPRECAGVAEKMAELQNEFGDNPKFQLISVSLHPEHDRPDFLRAWISAMKFEPGSNWWFLTTREGTATQGDALRTWIVDNFKMNVVRNSAAHIEKNPADIFNHDIVMVLVDQRGDIRSPTDNDVHWKPFHSGFNNDWYPRPIREDILKLLEEAK
jgi:protein SCO1